VKDRLPRFLDDKALAAGVVSALAITESAPPTVVRREPNSLASTFPSDVVTCQLASGAEVRLLCKYGGNEHAAYGHRGGVRYEAEVYRRLLDAAAATVPRFYAAEIGPAGEAWLAIGYLEHARRLNEIPDPNLWKKSAAWSGRFHAEQAKRCNDPALSFLIDYDATYYAGWARRTAENAAATRAEYPWLNELCRRWEETFLELLALPRTVIHGEYYPKNILLHEGAVYPVDWESAALAQGEIDLAALTDHGDPEIVLRCEAAYRSARWPEGPPPEFTRAMDVARLYIHLRWLGATTGPKLRRRFRRYDEARVLDERLGLI
jgi:hypothetical protein